MGDLGVHERRRDRTLRGDLVIQTRTMVFTMAGTVAALGALAIALSRL